MTNEFAENVLNFLAQKAGKDSIIYNEYISLDNLHLYDFFISDGVEDSYCIQRICIDDFEGINYVFQEECKRPYVIFLKNILDLSKQNITIYYGEMKNGIFLEPNTTLDQILIEMDLNGIEA